MRIENRSHSLAGLIFAALLTMLWGPAAHSRTLPSYGLRVDVQADGNARIALSLVLDPNGAATRKISLPFPRVAALRIVEGPAGAAISVSSLNDQTNLVLSLISGTSGPVTLKLEGEVSDVLSEPSPAGRTVRVALLNTQPEPLRDVKILVTFPEETRAHAIREALPKLGKGEAGPRASLVGVEGRAGLRLYVDHLFQGETASVKADLTSTSRSSGWWMLGLLLSALYLRSFRDLVRTPHAKEPS